MLEELGGIEGLDVRPLGIRGRLDLDGIHVEMNHRRRAGLAPRTLPGGGTTASRQAQHEPRKFLLDSVRPLICRVHGALLGKNPGGFFQSPAVSAIRQGPSALASYAAMDNPSRAQVPGYLA